MDQVGHLNQLHEKYFDQGLRVIAISPEPMGTLESQLGNARYWIGSDPGRNTSSQFLTGRGGGIPHAYLVDALGKIVSDLHPARLQESQIEELLADAFAPDLGRELHPSLKSLVKLYEKGQYGKAWTGAARLVAHDNREVRADALYLRERTEACAGFHRKLVESGIQRKDYPTVYGDLKEVSKVFAGMEVAKWAAETKRKLDAEPAVAREVKAWKALRKAQAKEEKAGGRAKKLGSARTAYKSIMKKYPGTRAAEVAAKALRRLGG
ncbi:MAG: thioredoxin domain-containing protein [Planctomycetota bacterium]|jgi:hypothetical protein